MQDWRTFQEAGAVGMLLVPVYATVKDALRPMRFQSERNKDYLTVFVSGVLFHILAEATGVNAYYIQHSAATHKWLSASNKDVAPDPRAGDSRVSAVAVWCCR